jgi:hypothetical protein
LAIGEAWQDFGKLKMNNIHATYISRQSERKVNLSLIFGLLLSVFSLQSCLAFLVFFYIPDWQTRGQFGDMFGTINSIFSGLNFSGLLYTLLLQREALALQQSDFNLTREELRRTAQAQENSEVLSKIHVENAKRAAELAAVSVLLSHYRQEISKFGGYTYSDDNPLKSYLEQLKKKEQQLLNLIEKHYKYIGEPYGHPD